LPEAGDRLERFLAEHFGGAGTLAQHAVADAPSVRFDLSDIDQLYRPFGDQHRRWSFDLPGPLSRRRRRVRQSVERAVTLFEELFDAGDEGFFVAHVWPDEDVSLEEGAIPQHPWWIDTENEARLLGVLPAASRDRLERDGGVDYWGDLDEDDPIPYVRLLAPCVPRSIDYRSLFLMTAQLEMGLRPAVSARVYLVDETRPALFHMYDDRGALAFAPTAERLEPLANAHRSWVLA
jgi:hypothetical protein